MTIENMDLGKVESRIMADFSLLATSPPRDLELALAEYAAKAKTGSKEMETANRLFHHMTPAAQFRVRCLLDGMRRAT